MSQFDRYDNPEMQRECDWEVFIDKENPNIVNVRFGRFKEITIPPKFQWEEGQYIRFLDIDSEKIQECDFSVNGVLDATIHYVNDGLVEIPNSIFTHHGNARVFVKHVGEDNITVVKVISFIVNRREKPQEYVSPDDEQTFRQWVQEQLDEGLIADITEVPSEEDDGLNIITITMRDGYEYVFTVKNGSKGDPGPGVSEGGVTGQILVKKSDEDYDTEWVEIPTSVNVVQEEGQSTEDVMSQKAVSDSLESIRENKMNKDADAVEDNIAIFDANGNAVDSGVNLDNIQVECDDHLDTESENPVQNKVLADIIPYKADYTYVNSKVDELNTSIGTKASTTYVETALSGKADVTDLPDSDELVPSFSITEAGKVLAVANDGESTTWATVESGSDLPDIQSGDAGKVLTVNQEEDGTLWSEIPTELPAVSSVDAGKVLQVSGVGQWVANEITTSSVIAFSGSGAPTSSLVAKVGDLYRDTTNNKFYQCAQYLDPSAVTDLTGITLTLNTTPDIPLINSTTNYSINFTSDNSNYTVFSIYCNTLNANPRQLWYLGQGGFNYVYQEGWNNEAYRTISITGGTDATNTTLINWLLTNSSSGGSTWVEVTAIPDGIPSANGQVDGKVLKVLSNAWVVGDESKELPTVSASDKGKVLSVNNTGNWTATSLDCGTYSHSGSSAPTSVVIAKVGDIYRDTANNKLYQCSAYSSPTTLLNKTVTFNTPLDFSGVSSDQEYVINFTYGTNNSTGIKLTSDGHMYYKNSNTGTWNQVYYNGTWNNIYGNVIAVTGGTDVENQSLLNFVETNGNVSGTGSTWVEVVAKDIRVPDVTSVDEGKVLTVDNNGDWSATTPSGGGSLPDVTYTDFGKRLTVSSNGVWSAYPTFFHGNGAPSSNLGNCVGDIYYDDLNGYTYVCTKYVSIPEHFTTLAGLSITMKSQVNFESAEGLTNFTYKCHETPPNSSMGTLVWYDGSTEPYYSYKCSGLTTNGLSVVINGWSWGAWSVDFTHGTSSYQNVPFYRNSTSNKQTIIFPNTFDEDTGTEPQDVIDFFINNAFSINNLGATWTMVIDGRLPAPPSMDDDILVGNNGSWVLNSSVHQNGVVFDRNPNNQNSNYNRSIPGNSFDVYNNSIMSISLDGNSKDVCWTTASNVQSLKRHAFKTLMNDKDASITSITSNESLSHWKYCQPGCYGYIGDSVASTLQGCPTTTAFVMVSTVLNRAYYYTSPNLNSLNSSYIIRYIFTWDGKIYKQNVQVDNMANYTYGNWYRITTSEEVPDAPTIDGNYVLKCSVSSGVPTYAWDAV